MSLRDLVSMMLRNAFRSLWPFLLVLVCWAGTASSNTDVCPADEDILQQINERQGLLSESSTQLRNLMNGVQVELPLNTLFVVNLSDQPAVDRRIAELRKEATLDEESAIKDHRFFACLENKKDLQERLIELVRLERSVASLRLSFLSLPSDHRRALLDSQDLAQQQAETMKELAAKKSESSLRSEVASEAVRVAESNAQRAESADLRNLATERAVLERYRKSLADLSVQMASKLTAINQDAKSSTAILTKDAALLSREDPSLDELNETYQNATGHWRRLVDEVLQPSTLKFDSVPLPPSIPTEILEPLKASDEAKEYVKSRSDAEKEYAEAQALRNSLVKESSGVHYRLLLLAGRVRAQLVSEINDRGGREIFALSNDYIDDVIREFRLIPFRPMLLVQTSFIEAKELVTQGISGILILLKRILLLIGFVLTPFVTFALLKRLSRRIDGFRASLVQARSRFPSAIKWALWIKRINPYLTWIMLIIATRVAAMLVDKTELEAVAQVLPYFEFFFLYRIFLIMIEHAVVGLTSYLPRDMITKEITLRISKTAKFLARFFLISAYVLHATQSVTRTGLVYHLVWDVLTVLTPILLAIAAYWWRFEIAHASTSLLPEALSSRFGRWSKTNVSAFLSALPAAALLVTVVALKKLVEAGSQFDASKRLSAKIFRKKLESAAKSTQNNEDQEFVLDERYKAFFSLGIPDQEELILAPDTEAKQDVLSAIDDWLEGSREAHTIAIQGEKGVGKSTFLRQIELTYKDHRVIRFSVNGKVTDVASLYQMIGSVLQVELPKGAESLLVADKSLPKTIVLIDEAQNLFLARRGGFEAFRAFTSLLNCGTQNILWCIALNRYSWTYLNAVTGGSEYFRLVRNIDRWSDQAIKDMIISRHARSGYALTYDPVIFATESSDSKDSAKYIQDRFFQLLWEQSRGNPRTALVLWLSAVRSTRRNKLLVGLPTTIPSNPLAGLTDDELFVIASVVRHENLTAGEAQQTTSLPVSTVTHACRIGEERGFLYRSNEGRYRVQPLWQYPLTLQLIGKNFVYE